MMRLWSKAAPVLASALVVAGCGEVGMPGGGGGGGGGVPSGTPASGKQAIAQCEQTIQSAPQLSGKVKTELEDVCKDAASGDQKAVRKATREVCESIVEESVPSGPARKQAQAACKQGP